MHSHPTSPRRPARGAERDVHDDYDDQRAAVVAWADAAQWVRVATARLRRVERATGTGRHDAVIRAAFDQDDDDQDATVAGAR